MAYTGTNSNMGSTSACKGVNDKPLWRYVTRGEKTSGGGTISWTCDFCNQTKQGSYTRVRAHLLNIPGKGVATCKEVRMEDLIEMENLDRGVVSEPELVHPKDEPLSCSPESNPGTGSNFLKRMRVDDGNVVIRGSDDEMRLKLDSLIAKMFYTGGVPFSLAMNPFFIEAFSFAANNQIPDYSPPDYDRLSTSLLEEEMSNVKRLVESGRNAWRGNGVTIVSNGWSDMQRMTPINFVAVSGTCSMFIKAVDTLGEVKDMYFISELLKEVIEEVGSENVVQVITDNTSICKAAGEIIEQTYRHIFWSPCAVHTLNIALKNICAAKNVENNVDTYEECFWISKIYEDAMAIKNFIMTHSMRLVIFNKFSSLKLLSVADTRFAHVVVTLKRLKLVKYSLLAMVVSEEWPTYKSENVERATFVKKKLIDDEWWEKIDYILEFTRPIYNMIWECDVDKPTLHLVYGMWDTMIDEVRNVIYEHECKELGDVSPFFQVMYAILTACWDKSNTPLHCLAYSLSPKYYCDSWLDAKACRVAPFRDAVIAAERNKCFIRLFPDREELTKVKVEFANFVLLSGPFGKLEAVSDRDALDPKTWWGIHGFNAPILQDIALKLLGQVSSSSCSERNWSTYGFIHSVKKNQLFSKRAEDLMYVHNNHRLLARRLSEYKQRKWDIYGDGFGSFEDVGLLDIAFLSLDEPELEAAFF